MSARDVMLERVRQARRGRACRPPVPRAYAARARRRTRRRRGVRRARPRLPRDRRRRRATQRPPRRRCSRRTERGGSGSRRTSTRGCGPTGVELVEDEGLSPRELDGLDGALTTCAAACAVTGTIALDGGPGQGRRALTLAAGSPRLRRAGGPDRRDRARARPPPRASCGCRAPARPRLGPVCDLRHRARAGRGRPRAATARRDRRELGRGSSDDRRARGRVEAAVRLERDRDHLPGLDLARQQRHARLLEESGPLRDTVFENPDLVVLALRARGRGPARRARRLRSG